MGESFRGRFESEEDDFIHPDEEDLEEEIDTLAPYKPGFWGTFSLAVVLLIHVLIWLGQGWSVKFDCFINYTACDSLKEADYVQVTPALHRGKAQIVPLYKEGTTDFFLFQRRKFVYDKEKGSFCKLNFKVAEPISFYTKAKDLSVEEAQSLKHQYGENKFEIPLPKFSEMYKQQLLSPIFCFQIFCVLLWALEDYWQYSLFTLALLFGSEATIVKTRLMTIQKLRGMGNRPLQVQVYRSKKWRWISSEELVPGDFLRLRYGGKSDKQPTTIAPSAQTPGAVRPANKPVEATDESIVPCDCLILSGSAVVNEATLTGESVPQMKEAIEEVKRSLELKGEDKIHILFAGTKLLEVKGGKDNIAGDHDDDTVEARLSKTSKADEQSCICYVVRTGFGSSQGKLVRRIEYSTETVAANRDPLYLILFLFVFALIAAGYVLKRGMEEKKRTHYQLLIHCILIITNVIPPDLPMQMAFAVNTSLVTLMQLMVFCIEPFRIPLAGQVQLCFFDKTGTITTDKLVAAGILQNRKRTKESSGSEDFALEPLNDSSQEAQMVIAGCHSLVQVGDQLIGDPLESASFSAVNWAYNSKIQTAFMKPKTTEESTKPEGQAEATKTEDAQTSESLQTVGGAPAISLQIVHRHHFSSKLQRMSVIARITRHSSTPSTENFVLVKGSPEAISTLLSSKSETKPEWYSRAYNFYTKKGMRVIAIAYRTINSAEDLESAIHNQTHAEQDLKFLGFVAFHCLVRKDSKEVIEELKISGHRVIMVTGDAALTASHVAAEVSVVSSDLSKVLRLVHQGSSPSSSGSGSGSGSETNNDLRWLSMDNDEVISDYHPNCVKTLRDAGYDLCVTGESLQAAQQIDAGINQYLHLIQVYSRMSPEQKESVLRIVKENKFVTLMCGDGTNDVGALKQADVGIALLSGFGDANSQAKDAPPKPTDPFSSLLQGFPRPPAAQGNQRTPTALDQIAWLNDPTVTPEVRKQRADMIKARESLVKDIEERKARGEWFASFKAIVSYAQKQVEEKQRALQRGENVSSADPTSFALSALSAQIPPAASSAVAAAGNTGNSTTPANPWEEMFNSSASTGEMEMVKLGDASIAAPFTSKIPSIRSVTDIVRQGRCTLITTLQMYQILALNCLISAYSLSVLYLDGVKYSDANLIMMGVFNMVSYLMISRGKPLPVLSHVRPPGSVFHPALFLSLIGQFIIHLSCLMFMTSLVKEIMETDPRYSSASATPLTTNWLSSKFAPSLMNTVVFLFSSIQQISVFAVNYKGRPFMHDITDNPSYMQSIILILCLIFVLASDSFQWLNDWLQLVRLPSLEFRNFLLVTIAFNVLGVIIWDRLVVRIFLPEVFEQMVKGLPERLWNLRTYFFGFVRMIAFISFFIYLTSDSFAEV